MAVALALCSAITYGVADFLGGRVAARAPALTVTLGSQAAGLVLVVALLLVLPGEASTLALVAGAGAGLAGGAGLVVYFRALAIGPMGVVAPVAGAVGAAVPILVGAARGERVGPLAVVAIVLGLLAVVLSSIDPAIGPPAGVPQPGELVRRALARAGNTLGRAGASVGDVDADVLAGELRRTGPLLGAVAGLAFGCFFVLLDVAPDDSGMWPLLGARLTSVPLLGLLALARGRPLPARPDWAQTIASGVLDVTANALFLLATREGLLVLVGLLVSLYPVVIVLLARQVLGERLERVQQVGVILALVAVVLVGLA